jgi:hypothetical protein
MVIARHIGTAIRAMAPGLSSLMEAALMIAGAVLIAYGTWLIYAPAGFITGGVLLIAGVILHVRGS